MQERITEEQDGDERVFRLFVDEKMVCSARIIPYSLLLDIKTVDGEEGKGYGKKLLAHIEKVAKEHNAVSMKTDDVDPCNYRAVCLLKSMGYIFTRIEGDKGGFVEARKDFYEILELIRIIDSDKDLFKRFDAFRGSMFFPTVSFLVVVFFTWFALFLLALQNVVELAVDIGLLAFVVGYFRLFVPFFKENSVEVNLRRLDMKKKFTKDKKPLVKALIWMKIKNEKFDLEQIYNTNPSMFTNERLLERLYSEH
jgi:GNAT superfamily N-acetyltransferase